MVDDDFEDEQFEEDEDLDSLVVQANHYTYSTIHEFLKKIIESFTVLHLSPDELIVVSKLHKLTSEIKYVIDGYASMIVKEGSDADNYTFMEIKFDADGLELTRGGYVTEGDWGGDSYGTIIFPVDDEDEAGGIMDGLEQFTQDFYTALQQQENEREFVDAVDSIRTK